MYFPDIFTFNRTYEAMRGKAINLTSHLSSRFNKHNHKYNFYPIKVIDNSNNSSVDNYWNEHTVTTYRYHTRWESDAYYRTLVKDHPHLAEFMQFVLDRSNQVVLDYGCGVGNDLYRLLIQNNCKQVTGIDVSYKALNFASNRLSLYNIDPNRITLLRTSNSNNTIPLNDNSIDHINCNGVLMHTENPQQIIAEFKRILRPNGTANIMVYLFESIWMHLYVAYYKTLIKGEYTSNDLDKNFAISTDGKQCPIARAYRIVDFIKILKSSGFNNVNFVGGYYTMNEIYRLRYLSKALKDPNLNPISRTYLGNLQIDPITKLASFNGKLAGVSGVFRITNE